MAHRKPLKLFFAGTDTDVGKTYVASLAAEFFLQQGNTVGVYKPVASGCHDDNGTLVAGDALSLWQAAGRPRTLNDVCPQRFREPLAPPEAARAENREVDRQLLEHGYDCWSRDFDVVIVEGAGGLFSPLADGMLNIDLVTKLSPQVIIVAANRLGVIHQTLSVCEAAANRGLRPVGIVLCDPTGNADDSSSSNASQISQYCSVPLLGTVPHGGTKQDVAFLKTFLP